MTFEFLHAGRNTAEDSSHFAEKGGRELHEFVGRPPVLLPISGSQIVLFGTISPRSELDFLSAQSGTICALPLPLSLGLPNYPALPQTILHYLGHYHALPQLSCTTP
jgi:hypothetical protein